MMVYLVDDQQQRLAGLAQATRDVEIRRSETALTVHDEKQQIARFKRNLNFGSDLLRKFCVGARSNPAGIYDLKGSSPVPANGHDTIAGDAGHIVDNGDFLTDQPIE
jgi:hypothetical protein